MTIKEKILKLTHGDNLRWNVSSHGKAEVWFIHNSYLLFSIPRYGGSPQFISRYRTNRLDMLISQVDGWA